MVVVLKLYMRALEFARFLIRGQVPGVKLAERRRGAGGRDMNFSAVQVCCILGLDISYYHLDAKNKISYTVHVRQHGAR